jgi:putative oxidoreductase
MSAPANVLRQIATITSCANAVMSRIPDGLLQLLARVAIAPTFFRSGQAKINGFSVNDSTVFLFEHEFGMPFPVLSAHLAALAENILPVLLVVGFATRLSALALFVMTIVIQIVAPQGFWTFHILWFAVLLYVVAKGPGQVSVDHLIDRAYRNRTA